MMLILSLSIWMDGTRPPACHLSVGTNDERAKSEAVFQSAIAVSLLPIKVHSNMRV